NPRHQPPHGVFVIKSDVHALQMAEDLAAQVEHHHLPGTLHEIGLEIFQQEAEHQQSDVQQGDLSDASERILTQERIKRRMQPWNRREIAVNYDLGEIRSENICSNLQQNRAERNSGLP